MAERKVEIDVHVNDDEARARLREDAALKDRLGKDVTVKVHLDTPSGFKLDKFVAQFERLSKLDARPSIFVDGLAPSLAGALLLEKVLKRLDGTTVRYTVKSTLDNRTVVDRAASDAAGGGRHGGGIAGLLGGFAGRFGKWFGALSGPAQVGVVAAGTPTGAAIAANILGIIASMVSALVPTAIGGAVGAGGLLGAYSLDPKAFKGVTKQLDQTFLGSLQQAPGFSPSSSRASSQAFLPTGGPSFLTGILGILKQVSGFIKTIGPSLAKMFQASLPFVKMFTDVLEKAGMIMMPAFTQAMKLMTPYLPIMAKGFINIVKGMAGFINALGPGMKAGSEVFLAVTKVIEVLLIGLGHAFAYLAIFLVHEYHDIRATWDLMRHEAAVIFDGIRHEVSTIWDMLWRDIWVKSQHGITDAERQFDTARRWISNLFDTIRHEVAHIWDMFWNDTIGQEIRSIQTAMHGFDLFRHETAVLFDGIRHDVAHLWDLLWSDLINAGKRFASTVINGWVTLGKDIFNTVRHIPGIMYQEGKDMLTELYHGALSMVGLVLHFFQGLGHDILHVFDVITGRHSPSREMYLRGQDLMRGLAKGMQSHFGQLKSISGKIGGSVVGWIEEAMKLAGAPQSWLRGLERIVQLESGGNPRAVNPQAVGGEHASGLFQTLPSTYAAYATVAGGVFNPVSDAVAAIRYIRAQYGSPYNIPGLFSGAYHGYAGGGWVNEPVVGMGLHTGSQYAFAEHGREYVSPGGGGGNVYITVAGDSDPDAAARRIWLKLRDLKRHNGHQPLGLA